MNPNRLGPFVVCVAAAAVFFADFRSVSAQCIHSLSFVDLGSPPGELTGDGIINVTDVQCAVVVSLWTLSGSSGTPPSCLKGPPVRADVQCDGNINIVDVIIQINLALQAPLDPALDKDGDLCPDDCAAPQVVAGFPTYTRGETNGGGFRLRPAPISIPTPTSASGGGYILKARPLHTIPEGEQP
ncbi:MAG: hypothetical protein HUU55_12180 [Myxococcales bacterium]|nr:hypothetical protein [Myxococcales bacterium]